MARRTLGMVAVGVALRLATAEPGSFLTAPQRDSMLGAITRPSVAVSADGRYVAFESYARLVPADTNDQRDIYVLELQTRRVTLESMVAGSPADAAHPRLSGDGRFLVFESTAFAPEGATARSQIVLCDRWTATSTVVTTGPGGAPADGPSHDPDISDDGHIVVFASNATNLAAGVDANGREEDIYALDVRAGTMQRVSLDSAGAQPATGASFSPRVSGDGRWTTFASDADLGPTTGARRPRSGGSHTRQVYVRDLVERLTTPVSAGSGAATPDGDSWGPAIGRDGRFVAFVSEAANLIGGDRNRAADVFLRDLRTGSLTLVSRSPDGESGNGTSVGPAISADGRFVAFQSDASNLVCAKRCSPKDEDINLLPDVFVFDRDRKTIIRVSGDDAGGWMEGSRGPALDGSGQVLAFASRHPIDALDRGDDFDLFVQVEPGPGGEPESWGRAFRPAPTSAHVKVD
jgi:Tol biopolymer transport system component